MRRAGSRAPCLAEGCFKFRRLHLKDGFFWAMSAGGHFVISREVVVGELCCGVVDI